MIKRISDENILVIDPPDDYQLYEKHGKKKVDSIIDLACLAIPCMVAGRPYDAVFILWPIWETLPVAHHCTLGKILSEIVQSGLLPLHAESGKEVGSTRILYFLDEAKLKDINRTLTSDELLKISERKQ